MIRIGNQTDRRTVALSQRALTHTFKRWHWSKLMTSGSFLSALLGCDFNFTRAASQTNLDWGCASADLGKGAMRQFVAMRKISQNRCLGQGHAQPVCHALLKIKQQIVLLHIIPFQEPTHVQ